MYLQVIYLLIICQVEVHGREIQYRGLMDIDIQAVVGLHLQGGLQPSVGEALPGPAAADMRAVVQLAHLAEAALGVVELLCVVVARYPPCHGVARHSELRQLVGEPEGDEGIECVIV